MKLKLKKSHKGLLCNIISNNERNISKKDASGAYTG